ncbi:MAG TPA: NlpC/P60 family protein [Negativicutes bacterium]|nr:NlpC/P60 family protein [Negativicutes bacterium]
MRNKLLNNNQPNYISKGGVLYKPGEIPALTKEQLTQASLVSKLPRDFPFANWEGMTTKQQLRTIGYSGLTAQEQWSLLNANVPLSVLNEHNQAQEYAAAQASPVQAPALLSAKAVQALAQNFQKTNTNSSISPSLQSGVPQRKLEEQKENLQTKLLGKPAIAAANPVKITNPTKTPYSYKPLEKGDGSGDTDGEDGKKESWFHALLDSIFAPKEKPKASPQIVPITTVEPRPTIPMTPTPKPTTTPSPTPKQGNGVSPSSAKKEAMLDEGFKFLDDAVNSNASYCFDTRNHSRYGKEKPQQFDCSGLAISFILKCGSKLPFGTGYISNNCAGMVDSIRGTDYGEITYDYKNDQDLPELQRGDFVFYADPKNLSKDVHVAIATGETIYDPMKKKSYPEVVEASAVAKKVTGQYLAYNGTNKGGLYTRDHSGQIITHVVQWNLEWDDMD